MVPYIVTIELPQAAGDGPSDETPLEQLRKSHGIGAAVSKMFDVWKTWNTKW